MRWKRCDRLLPGIGAALAASADRIRESDHRPRDPGTEGVPLAYHGREELADREDFLAQATGMDPALRITFSLVLLTGGQVADENGTCSLDEAESRAYLAIAEQPSQEIPGRGQPVWNIPR